MNDDASEREAIAFYSKPLDEHRQRGFKRHRICQIEIPHGPRNPYHFYDERHPF